METVELPGLQAEGKKLESTPSQTTPVEPEAHQLNLGHRTVEFMDAPRGRRAPSHISKPPIISSEPPDVRGTPQGHMTPTSCSPVEFPHSWHNSDNRPGPAMWTLSIHLHSKLATSQLTHTTNPSLTHTSNQLTNPLSAQAQLVPTAPALVMSIDQYIPPHQRT